MQKQLELRFKGARDYLHGTDMFNALLEWVTTDGGHAVASDIDVSFHRIVSAQPAIVWASAEEKRRKPAATCAFTSHDGQKHSVFLVESDSPVTGRYPYDEDGLVREMVIDAGARCGVFRGRTEFTAIEVWVAMTKAVHLRVFDPKKKWLFVRARFPKFLRTLGDGDWTTTIVGNFNDRLTRSEIGCDGRKVGEIYFSPRLEHAGH